MGDLSLRQILDFLAAPFVASLILTGIHAYLGVHVVERGVIFVDLSLAQIAALGATIAIFLPFSGGDPHAPSVYWVSLLFTFIGAGIFSVIRGKRSRIPQEAIIGISYAVASAAAILAMSKSTSESEHLKDMLVGNIIAVSWPEVGKTAALYGAVGIFHYIFRKQFLTISMNHDDAEATGLNVRFWDFLFYASFGFVVTSSVAIAGVLLVFCYLIVPSVAAMLFADTHREATRDRLDDGNDRFGSWRVFVPDARSADGSHDRLHFRPGAGVDVDSASGDAQEVVRASRFPCRGGVAPGGAGNDVGVSAGDTAGSAGRLPDRCGIIGGHAMPQLRDGDRGQSHRLLPLRNGNDRSRSRSGAGPAAAPGRASACGRRRAAAAGARSALRRAVVISREAFTVAAETSAAAGVVILIVRLVRRR